MTFVEPLKRWHLSLTYGAKFCFLSRKIDRCLGARMTRTHARTHAHVSRCASLFVRTSPKIDERFYLRRGTSYDLTSCVFRVMPRDLIVLLIINCERRYTSREMPATGSSGAHRVRCLRIRNRLAAFLNSFFGTRFFMYYKRANCELFICYFYTREYGSVRNFSKIFNSSYSPGMTA